MHPSLYSLIKFQNKLNSCEEYLFATLCKKSSIAFVRLKMRSKFYFQPDIQFSDPRRYQEDMAGLAEGQ